MNDRDFGPRLFSITEVKARLGIGNTTVYQEISSGRLVALKIGARTLVTAESLERYIEGLPRADVTMKLPPRYAAVASQNRKTPSPDDTVAMVAAMVQMLQEDGHDDHALAYALAEATATMSALLAESAAPRGKAGAEGLHS